MTLVVDEDVSRQVTLNREGDVIIGASMAVSLPYSNGKLITVSFLLQHLFFLMFGGTLLFFCNDSLLLRYNIVSTQMMPFCLNRPQQNKHSRLCIIIFVVPVYHLSLFIILPPDFNVFDSVSTVS